VGAGVPRPSLGWTASEGEVADGRLTFEGPARFQYGLDDEGKIRANADGTISVAWSLRDENGAWERGMHNTFRKDAG
jgi:hypothetical protein